MHTVLVSLGAVALLMGASFASAQSYYPTYSTSNCTVISRDLSIGSRGADVTTLQRFLVAQNYPGGGSWMSSGYFGQATAAAVRNYQVQRGLATTGVVDGATRASLAACGSVTPNYPSYPTPPTYPSYPSTPIYPTYPTGNTPNITSLSLNQATQGTSVTVYGSNFQHNSTVVRIGGTNVPATLTSNMNSLSFIVPNLTPGTYQISVSTAFGASNALPFTVIPAYPCNTNSYGGSCGCGAYGSRVCPGGPISLTFLSPSQGAVGSTVNIYGSGFTSSGNTVRFGNAVIANLNSFDSTTLSFTVPNQLSGYGYSPITLSSYYVSVTNGNGQSSNALPFMVTSLGSAGAPSITGLSGPSTLAAYSTGTWSFTLNNQTNTYTTVTVNWGDNTSNSSQIVYNQGLQTMTLSHAYVNPGTYTINFTAMNQSGQTSMASATVQVTGATGTLSLSHISPTQGRVGTQVMLVGSGFSALANTVRFGVGGTQHLVSQNGTVIYYTIPSYVSSCDLVSGSCNSPAQQVTPGTYTIFVLNQNGTTNPVNFTVTQ